MVRTRAHGASPDLSFDALAPTTTQGDLIYHDGSDNVRLARGTAAQVLAMNSGATAPEWVGVTAFAGRRDATGQVWVTGAYTTATFDVEEGDVDGAGSTWFVHTTGTATAPRDGWYTFSGTLSCPGIDAGELVRLAIFVNGVETKTGGDFIAGAAGQTVKAHISATLLLAATNTVTLQLIHNEGANQTQAEFGANAWFSGAQIR